MNGNCMSTRNSLIVISCCARKSYCEIHIIGVKLPSVSVGFQDYIGITQTLLIFTRIVQPTTPHIGREMQKVLSTRSVEDTMACRK